MYVLSAYVSMNYMHAVGYGGQERALGLLELEFQAVMWVLGLEPRPFGRTASILNH